MVAEVPAIQGEDDEYVAGKANKAGDEAVDECAE
jgi:hypothetical protein